MTAETYLPGEKCVWLHTPRGGYGYQIPVNATVVAATRKRIRIEVRRNDGEMVRRWVKPESLRKAVQSEFEFEERDFQP